MQAITKLMSSDGVASLFSTLSCTDKYFCKTDLGRQYLWCKNKEGRGKEGIRYKQGGAGSGGCRGSQQTLGRAQLAPAAGTFSFYPGLLRHCWRQKNPDSSLPFSTMWCIKDVRNCQNSWKLFSVSLRQNQYKTLSLLIWWTSVCWAADPHCVQDLTGSDQTKTEVETLAMCPNVEYFCALCSQLFTLHTLLNQGLCQTTKNIISVQSSKDHLQLILD